MAIIFREVVKSDGFQSLSFESVVKIISCNDLAVPFEEKVSKLQLVIDGGGGLKIFYFSYTQVNNFYTYVYLIVYLLIELFMSK